MIAIFKNEMRGAYLQTDLLDVHAGTTNNKRIYIFNPQQSLCVRILISTNRGHTPPQQVFLKIQGTL